MPTQKTSYLAVRHRRALVESVLGHSVDWSGLPDPNGYIEEVLDSGYDRPGEAPLACAAVVGDRANYYPHAAQSAASLLDLVRSHSTDHRVADPMAAWSRGGEPDGTDDAAQVYRVLGWTTTAILRWTLSSRLDSLNPVAAFRLLDQPEISILDRSNRDYVILQSVHGAGRLAGAVSAADIDLWRTSGPDDLDHAFAVDVETYRTGLTGTGVAA